jgi:hypothetical protein
MVSAVAPQTPRRFAFSAAVSAFFLGAGTRQGPMLQFLQQLPSAPIGQGFISSARSKAVLIFSAAAFCSILRLAESKVFFANSGIPSSLFYRFFAGEWRPSFRSDPSFDCRL